MNLKPDDLRDIITKADGMDSVEMRKLVEKLFDDISKNGFDDVCKRWQTLEREPETKEMSPSDGLVIIPFPTTGKNPTCKKWVVVFANEKLSIHFDSVMVILKTYLEQCWECVEGCIIVTDHWSSKNFEEKHLTELDECGVGITFLFLIVGSPDKLVFPLGVQLCDPKIAKSERDLKKAGLNKEDIQAMRNI